ncbi:DUF6773 family protein [Paenibacillus lautus]|uniref:DUF6773 family protein n=1 Tax=Paenibacillus lautus TaxID=1401 RepID=UPI000FDBCDDC|nr:DUF6773 family protein [Paenibacillus lautus]
MNSKDLDEMQLARRNHIGNQSFMLLFYLLFLDIGLRGFGVTWLDYPVNVFLIMIVCMSCYLIRLLFAGAYTGQKVKGKPLKKSTAALLLSVITCVTAIVYSSKLTEAMDDKDGTFLILAISIAVLVLCVVFKYWSNRRNNRGEE